MQKKGQVLKKIFFLIPLMLLSYNHYCRSMEESQHKSLGAALSSWYPDNKNKEAIMRYRIAIRDTERAQSSEVINHLINIEPHNKFIIWENTNQEDTNNFNTKLRVINVTNLQNLGYTISREFLEHIRQSDDSLSNQEIVELIDDNSGVEISLTKDMYSLIIKNLLNDNWQENETFPENTHSFYVNKPNAVSWVTCAPELLFKLSQRLNNKETNNIDKAMINKKCHELLGLQALTDEAAQKANKIIIELLIAPEDLFRPSIDAEIFDKASLPDKLYDHHLYKNLLSTTSSTVFDNLDPIALCSMLIFINDFINDNSQKLKDEPLYKESPEFIEKIQFFLNNNREKIEELKQNNKALQEYITTNEKDINNLLMQLKISNINLLEYWYFYEKSEKYAYTNTWRMPWTRLGYTFDYSQEAFSSTSQSRFYGLSEFIIKPFKKSKIIGIYSLENYIHKKFEPYKNHISDEIKKYTDTQITIITNNNQSLDISEANLNEVGEKIKKIINAYNNLIGLKKDIEQEKERYYGMEFFATKLQEIENSIKNNHEAFFNNIKTLIEKEDELIAAKQSQN